MTDLVELTERKLLARYQTTLRDAAPAELHECLGSAVMEEIAPRWLASERENEKKRRAAYLSAEYLMGRLVFGNLLNLGLLDEARRSFAEKGVDLDSLEEIEDAALGNGGLGRLAACYLESAASCGIPLTGYGLRYRCGLFRQEFSGGSQKEFPDDWTRYGDPWSVRRDRRSYDVTFADQTVRAVAYDLPVPGYGGKTVGTLRLWQSEATEPMDFAAFNEQKYEKAARKRNRAEDITCVLYPNDTTNAGKRLRIKQQYLLCSASLQDLLADCRRVYGDVSRFAEFYAVQLNDTHPAMAIPELTRLLMAEGMDFAQAFSVVRRTFSYTNHTVMAEALEKWDLRLLRSVVPEIAGLILKIDGVLRAEQPESGLYIVKDRTVHMANLSVFASSAVNGVAEIHSDILRRNVFGDWYDVWPERFTNVTNGVTPRRWLGLCNPELTGLLHQELGGDFLGSLDRLREVRITPELCRKFIAVKQEKKRQLAAELQKREKIIVSPDWVFDVQIKRLHEYKRQLLNAFSVLDLYFRVKDGSLRDLPPTVFLFGAKAAPGYVRAKAIIRFVNRIAALVNGDPDVNGTLQIVFVQNYNCSWAEKIIPAADLSEQISPAGTEASGTGNMKLMLNGAVTLGTLDGANVEIVEAAGKENNVIFGATVEELDSIRADYDPVKLYRENSRLRRVVDALTDGTVETDEEQAELRTALLEGASWHKPDHYFLLHDFASYAEAKERAIRMAAEKGSFAEKCLRNVTAAGRFSSDRAIRQYAEKIWHISE